MHEVALVGLDARAGDVLGSYAPDGAFAVASHREIDMEQDVFGALRILDRGQLALLVPFVETHRTGQGPTGGTVSQLGGGVGDINLAARYDFLRARESSIVPGIALLVGLTVPTGRAPESATPPLQADATGIGAFQLNVALALEQTFGPWLVNATAIVAKRTEHGGEVLGTQLTFLAAGAYTFDNEASLALSASYAFEGDATCSSDGEGLCATGTATIPGSSKAVTTLTLSGLWPLSDAWRLLGGVYVSPPIDHFGTNEPATQGLTLTVIHSWN
jgi:Putative MetA-pathway of phenol degradation